MASLLPLPLQLPLSSPVLNPKSLHSTSSFHKPTTDDAPKRIRSSKSESISCLCREGLLVEAFALLAEIEESDELPISPEIYGELLQGCVHERALFQGRQIHARLLKSGAFFYKNDYIHTKLLVFYAKCDSLAAADELFSRQRHRNLFSWAAMIGLHSRLGLSQRALVGFVEMLEASALPDNFVIPNALKACSELELIGFGRCIHGYALKMGFAYCVYVLSSLVDFYGKCGVLGDARKAFDEMSEKNVITWNSMLVGYSYNGQYQEVLELFSHMRDEEIQPTRVSISCFLSASANLCCVGEGRQGHSLAVLYGLELDYILGTSLINFYCKVGMVVEAEQVFHCMADKDVVSWNLLISGYVQNGQSDAALCACHQMRKYKFKFDCVTLASIMSVAISACNLELGKVGHGYCIRNNFETDSAIASSITDLYANCGRIHCARRAFDLTSSKNLVLWNSMIYAYAQYHMSGEALKLFYEMELSSIAPNAVSYNSIILAYLLNGQVNEAKDMFATMQISGVSPDIVTWTTLVYGLTENGCCYEAIKLYVQMQALRIRPSPLIIAGVLLACINIGSFLYGKAIHGHFLRQGFLSSPLLEASLVDMYAKCDIGFELGPRILASHITLANTYAYFGKWQEHSAVRMLIRRNSGI